MNKRLSFFLKINFFITILILVMFLVFNKEYTPLSFLLTLFGAISTAALLYLLVYILFFPLLFTNKIGFYVVGLVVGAINFIILSDFFIYKIFNFHINGMVLNILTSPDAFDSIQVGKSTILAFIILVATFIILEIWLIRRVNEIRNAVDLNKRINKKIILPLFLIVVGEKITSGVFELLGKEEEISNLEVIPFYQPLPFSQLASYFGFKSDKVHLVVNRDSKIEYPLKSIEVEAKRAPFNIFIFGIDSLKYSILDKETAPNLMEFKKDALWFNNHLSGGNSTRFGIFSFFYGLNSNYWFNFLEENRGTLFFDVLKKLNYKISVYSSTNTNWPEFKQTCYVDIKDMVKDRFEGESWQKDRKNLDAFLKDLNRTKDGPLFSFIFLDAPHGYSFPPNLNKFKAVKEEINYITISPDSAELNNTIRQYKNAVYYDDKLFGEFIRALKEKNLYDNSLIIFTSDHGQEFYEYGYFGHNTSFSMGQTHVPFVVKLPKGMEVDRNVTNKLTSHHDILPTLFGLLGVKADPRAYSNGVDIFDRNSTKDYVFIANWSNSAIVTKDRIYIFSTLKKETRDMEYNLLNEKVDRDILLKVNRENIRFLKSN